MKKDGSMAAVIKINMGIPFLLVFSLSSLVLIEKKIRVHARARVLACSMNIL
jgi:hypothetical protein